jgi:cytochrome c oxidase subunit 3
MNTRPALDVSGLPSIAFGSRDPLWWGLVALMAIEGLMFVLLGLTYFYLRGLAPHWPPTGITAHELIPAAIGAPVLLLSGVMMWRSAVAAERGQLRSMRVWLIASAVPSWAFIALRVWELAWLPFKWNSHAYGSVVWTLLGLHTFHSFAGSLEDVVLVVLLFKGPVEQKHLVDVTVNALYWYFVVAAGLAIGALVYLDPAVLRSAS